jgi:glycosyltransferase involved in cell wall biosynthesis
MCPIGDIMKGWLINDCLTCIPGTKTFWHDLLENIPGLTDKTNGYTSYEILPTKIETDLLYCKPDYIIRNASYFRKLNTNVPQISLLQDANVNRKQQVDVCNNSSVSIFNSKFVRDLYPEINKKTEIIPLGTDFDLFVNNNNKEFEADIIFIGSSNVEIKGFNKVIDLINNSNFTFNLVMKDDFKISHPRVKLFNKIKHDKLVNIINGSKVCICTSNIETLHLAGVECGACNVPIIATNTGIYYQFNDGIWGLKASNDFKEKITYVINNRNNFSPREFLLKEGLDKKTCMSRWKELVNGQC